VAACGPHREVAVGRELTKLHEEVWSGTLDAAVSWVDASTPRGEWVVVVGPAPAVVAPPGEEEIRAALEARLAGGCDRREAVAEVARGLRLPKREVYRIALSLNDPAS
jgi:16S rRNA (cytidine1402-2'-O)-methyltransferase